MERPDPPNRVRALGPKRQNCNLKLSKPVRGRWLVEAVLIEPNPEIKAPFE
jgi:hypothetical protein